MIDMDKIVAEQRERHKQELDRFLSVLDPKDWLYDGHKIRGDVWLACWHDLDWSGAWIDLGPSPAGNPGPYWHVPRKTEDTVHRLYPKILQTKHLPLVRAMAIAMEIKLTQPPPSPPQNNTEEPHQV